MMSLLLGCGTDSGVSQDPVPACVTVLEAQRAKIVSCPDNQQVGIIFTDDEFNYRCGLLAMEVTAGRLRFDGTQVMQCVAEIMAAPCPSLMDHRGQDACARIFQGTVTLNGACYGAIEC